MVAEPKQITSLKRAPDGREWRPGGNGPSRGNLDVFNSRAKGGSVPWMASADGPRPDVAETKYLPTLTPGLDKLPQRCIFCDSRLLDLREPAGGEQRGTLSCTGCGRPLAWLAPRMRTAAPPASFSSATHGGPAAQRSERAPTMRLPAGAAFERLDGCGPACGIRTGHDPLTHEGYGRSTARADLEDRPTGIVRTGLLTIDFDTARVTVGDRVAALTDTEYRLLSVLAVRLGKLCYQRDVVELVWGRATLDVPAARHDSFHIARVHLVRMRQELGEAAGLVETVPAKGLILRAEPPIGSERDRGEAAGPRVRRQRVRHRLAVRSGRALRLLLVGSRSRRARGGTVGPTWPAQVSGAPSPDLGGAGWESERTRQRPSKEGERERERDAQR